MEKEPVDPIPSATPYDLIVIGSGMGGLTVANQAARVLKKRVLVIEKHSKLGGYAHVFKRQQGKFEWDVSVHASVNRQAVQLAQDVPFLLKSCVEEILIREDRAVGVRLSSGEQYFAQDIVSDVGVYGTYCKLIPEAYPIPFRAELRELAKKTTSSVILFIGLSADPGMLGFEDTISLFEGHSSVCRLFFPSQNTAKITAFVDYEPFAAWSAEPVKRRSEAYQALKARIVEDLLRLVERHRPGFTKFIEFKELSTPLTNEHYTGHHRGAVTALPWPHVRTPIHGLYLAGKDVGYSSHFRNGTT